mmetsp:Transcript_66565/g.192187  ORF Transcript_66565/g.192187 Transcript_66565/m.192187 type:complete len:242 (-) Transcript_66565:104-829(-)
MRPMEGRARGLRVGVRSWHHLAPPSLRARGTGGAVAPFIHPSRVPIVSMTHLGATPGAPLLELEVFVLVHVLGIHGPLQAVISVFDLADQMDGTISAFGAPSPLHPTLLAMALLPPRVGVLGVQEQAVQALPKLLSVDLADLARLPKGAGVPVAQGGEVRVRVPRKTNALRLVPAVRDDVTIGARSLPHKEVLLAIQRVRGPEEGVPVQLRHRREHAGLPSLRATLDLHACCNADQRLEGC